MRNRRIFYAFILFLIIAVKNSD